MVTTSTTTLETRAQVVFGGYPLATEFRAPGAFVEARVVSGCRSLNGGRVETLLRVCGSALRSLDLNGAVATEHVTEVSLRQACPNLEHLDARGRARKH